MKQHQAPKETPRTKDKFKTFAFRCSAQMHKLLMTKNRGSGWARKVLAAAIEDEKK